MFVSAFSVSRSTANLGHDITNAAPNIRNGQHEPQPWREMEGKNPINKAPISLPLIDDFALFFRTIFADVIREGRY